MTALSARNPKVQRLRRLARQRSFREAERAFVLEGFKLVDEALAEHVELEAIFASPAVDPGRFAGSGVTVHVVDDDVLAGALDTVTPQGAAAIAPQRPVAIDELDVTAGPVLVLAGVADPGNAGTLVRTAEAAGCSAVVFTSGSVDAFSPKCVRASAGSIFRTPIVDRVDAAAALRALRAGGARCLGTSAREGTPHDEERYAGAVAIVLGSEAHGLPDDVAAELEGLVRVPMAGRAESLNVATTGAVVLFEAARQRRHAGARA